MTLDAFLESIQNGRQPTDLPLALQALWHAKTGNWHGAHQLAQDGEGQAPCDWVHAHLHRVEGDAGNARYWYSRAARPFPNQELDAEWNDIAAELLAASDGS